MSTTDTVTQEWMEATTKRATMIQPLPKPIVSQAYMAKFDEYMESISAIEDELELAQKQGNTDRVNGLRAALDMLSDNLMKFINNTQIL